MISSFVVNDNRKLHTLDNRKPHTFLTVRSGAGVRVGVAVPRLVLDAWSGTTEGRHQTHRSVPMDRVHPTTRSAVLSEVARSRFRCSRIPSCAKTRPFETGHHISSLESVFAPGPRAAGFTIVCPEGVIFRSMMTYHAQFLLLVVAGWVNRQQQDVIDYLQEENRVLRTGASGQASQAL